MVHDDNLFLTIILLNSRSRSIASLFKPFPDISPPFFFILPRRSKYNVERLAKPPKLPEDYEERNENLKRALSPHITIYKLEMPAHQSLAHRTTGILLARVNSFEIYQESYLQESCFPLTWSYLVLELWYFQMILHIM